MVDCSSVRKPMVGKAVIGVIIISLAGLLVMVLMDYDIFIAIDSN